MLYAILIGMIVILLIGLLVYKLCRSPKLAQAIDNIVKDKLDLDSTPKSTMNNISKEEVDLSKQSGTKIKEAKQLTKDSKQINNFLDKRGVSETKKGEDS